MEPCQMENFADVVDDEEEERQHFQSVLAAFAHYRKDSLKRINKTEKFIGTLPASQQKRLDKYLSHLAIIRQCIDRNETILDEIMQNAGDMFVNIPKSAMMGDCDRPHVHGLVHVHEPNGEDMDKVQTVLKLLARDWSSEGAAERQQCYQPIIDEIRTQFPEADGVSVLVPGAGLGRLAFDIAMHGYRCQGNDFSLFMLFSSNYVLNRCHQVNGYKIHPWIHKFLNNMSCDDQTVQVTFPDVDPSTLTGADFSMTAGDFLLVYTTPNEWDCIATCFFIDCASNVIEFVENIFNILKPGGVWINLGPLLYHFCDMATVDSIEPPFDVLCDIIKDVGFKMEKVQTGMTTKFCQNPKSMLQNVYESVFFVCRKPQIL